MHQVIVNVIGMDFIHLTLIVKIQYSWFYFPEDYQVCYSCLCLYPYPFRYQALWRTPRARTEQKKYIHTCNTYVFFSLARTISEYCSFVSFPYWRNRIVLVFTLFYNAISRLCFFSFASLFIHSSHESCFFAVAQIYVRANIHKRKYEQTTVEIRKRRSVNSIPDRCTNADASKISKWCIAHKVFCNIVNFLSNTNWRVSFSLFPICLSMRIICAVSICSRVVNWDSNCVSFSQRDRRTLYTYGITGRNDGRNAYVRGKQPKSKHSITKWSEWEQWS